MALVAYSDDSDLGSDTEEVEEHVNGLQNEVKSEVIAKVTSSSSAPQSNTSPAAPALQETQISSGVDTIVDDDDFEDVSSKKSSSLLASIPAAVPVNSIQNEIGEGEDELDDVPTLSTWKVTAEIQKDSEKMKSIAAASSSDKATFDPPKKKAKSKVQFFVPALSEFADEEEEEEPKEEPQRKKVMPSAKGTGLFSVLPEPKHISVKETKRPLIPHILTKPPPKQKPVKPKPAPKSKVEEANDSDEDNESSDFFSLSEPSASGLDAVLSAPAQAVRTVAPSVPSVQDRLPRNFGTTETSEHLRQTQLPAEGKDYDQQQEGVSYEFQPEMQVSEKPTNIDQEALTRLMGKRRRKGEEINFIDVSADDALLTRDEWMTKALTEEKPTHSYSKKREGLPSQKQKQKHQITYLAHQAKERELELKNNWAQNRVTKMQTQAKYGF